MLFKALQYFAVKWWDPRIKNRITYIDGETYWLYRLYLEGLIAVVACLGFFIAAFSQMTTDVMTGYLAAGVLSAVVGLLEMLRLARLLREQVEFAELFYG